MCRLGFALLGFLSQAGMALSFVPGALQLVRDGEIQVWPSSWPALVSPKMEVTVESPAGGFEKIQASLRAPAQVGLGSDILLDASRSTGPSRQFFYTVEALSLPIAWLDQVYVNEEEVFRNKTASVTNIVRRCVMEKDASSYGLSAVMLLNSALVSDLAQLLLPRNWDMSKKPSILPVEITFRVRCQSSLSATNFDETTASTSVYPFFAVPFLVKQQDSSGVRRIDEPLKMTAAVQVPNAVDLALLPRFNLTWPRQLENNDGENVGQEIDCRQFQQTNPGSQRHLCQPSTATSGSVGSWALALST